MTGKAKAWVFIAIFFIIGGILLAGIGVAMGGTLSYSYIYENGRLNFNNSTNELVSDSISVAGFSKLNVSVNTVDVHIIEGDEYTVSYNVPERFIPRISEGDTLTVEVPSQTGFAGGFFFINTEESPSITITVPASSEKKFDIEASTGDIFIENITFNGDIKSSTGDIKLISGKLGTVYLETSTGDIKLTGIDSPDVSISKSTGEAVIDKCSINKLVAKTSTGDVRIGDSVLDSFKIEGSTSDIALKDVTVNDVKVEIGTGECKLELNGRSSDYSCKLSTSTGDIKYDGDSFEKRYTHDGSGNGSIVVSTSTGDIKVSFSK